jgi:hypothetical protein
MVEIPKIWSRLGVALLAGTALTQPSAAHAPQSASSKEQASQAAKAAPQLLHLAQNRVGGEGAEGGEGGGEGGERGAPNPATDDVAYVTQLGLVRGHLNVGMELYRAGAAEAARTHMKHPADELYATLVPAFKARRTNGFDAALEKLSAAVEKGAPVSEADAAYAAVEKEIDRVQAYARNMPVKSRLMVAVNLVKEAAEEYAEGVENGVVRNAHEYQDAYGFTRTARRMVEQLTPSERARSAKVVDAMEQQFKLIEPAWPNVVPPERVKTDASLIAGAAARMELAVLSMN